MSFIWREHAAAYEELRTAVNQYEEIDGELSDRFIEAVEAAIASTLDPAFRWGFYRNETSEPQVYSRSINGFPFDLVYIIFDDEVFIVAYAHERRRPGYWHDRLKVKP